jgi:hypothetical protein
MFLRLKPDSESVMHTLSLIFLLSEEWIASWSESFFDPTERLESAMKKGIT